MVREAGDVPGLEGIPLDLRIANALVSYVKYLWSTVWPLDLACLYPHPMDTLSGWQVAGSFLLLAALTLLAVRGASHRPYLAVGWLWYLGTLVPVIGLVHVGAQGMADRFTYVPHIGLFVALVWGIWSLALRWPRRKALFSAVSCVILCFFTFSTWDQLRYWKNSVSLFSRAVRVTGDNFLALYFLGVALGRESRLAEAAARFSESLRLHPSNPAALYNLAYTLAREGRLEEATLAYDDLLRLTPGDATVHNNLGNLWARRGHPEQAVQHFLEALRVNPDYAAAHNNLANVLLKHGKLQEAIRHYSEALRIQSDFPEARHNLDKALKRFDEEKDKGPDETDPSR
jgi:tetratricopeptide (TPR) repeat protein